MQLPTIPSFSANETTVAHLAQLSAAVQFATVASGYPLWRFYKAAVQSIPASTQTTLIFASIAVDTDNVSNATGAQINTQGYYSCEACIPFEGASAINGVQARFVFTAGPNNAGQASGTVINFGGTSSAAAAVTGTDYALCMADKCPVACYPGDVLTVQLFCPTATSVNVLSNTSNTAGWFPAQFSGRWVRTGP